VSGRYQADVQPGSPHRTTWCPRPGCVIAPGQSHGDQLTITRPGPQACPAWHCAGYGHQLGTRGWVTPPSRTHDREPQASR
jgi:hypothetical protein